MHESTEDYFSECLSMFISTIMPTFNRVHVSAIVSLSYTAQRIGTWLALQAAPQPGFSAARCAAAPLPSVLLGSSLPFFSLLSFWVCQFFNLFLVFCTVITFLSLIWGLIFFRDFEMYH